MAALPGASSGTQLLFLRSCPHHLAPKGALGKASLNLLWRKEDGI